MLTNSEESRDSHGSVDVVEALKIQASPPCCKQHPPKTLLIYEGLAATGGGEENGVLAGVALAVEP